MGFCEIWKEKDNYVFFLPNYEWRIHSIIEILSSFLNWKRNSRICFWPHKCSFSDVHSWNISSKIKRDLSINDYSMDQFRLINTIGAELSITYFYTPIFSCWRLLTGSWRKIILFGEKYLQFQFWLLLFSLFYYWLYLEKKIQSMWSI